MNTPSHLVVNLALLGRAASPRNGRWIAGGALLPDAPMLGFYVWQRIVLDQDEAHIWGTAYFEPFWQTLFDVFHSALLFAALALLALALRRPRVPWLCASVLLHCLGDAFLHREDGHHHLWPLSNWRYQSPVSYWDPAHHGALGAGIETLAVIASAVALWSVAGRRSRVALLLLGAASAGGWLAMYGPSWGR